MADGMVFFFLTNNPTMAEFIEQVKLPACVLCLSHWDLHTFALVAGAMPLEGLLLKEYQAGERDHLIFV